MVDKIQGLDSLVQVVQKGPARAKGQGFSSVLEGLLRGEGVKHTTPVQTVGAPLRIERVDEIEARAGAALNELLEGLDKYRKLLGDRSVSLREVAKALEEVEEKAVELAKLRKSLPERLPLSGVVDEALSIVYAEGIKFRRGDYT